MQLVAEAGRSSVHPDRLAGGRRTPGPDDGVGRDARFFSPTGIVSDGRGHLYVSDLFLIRRIELDTLLVTTLQLAFGGDDGTDTLRSPSGLALDNAGMLYVADSGSHVIRRIDLRTLEVTVVAGALNVAGFADGIASDARFAFPRALVFDAAGALVVSDTGNAVVRKIDLATGAVSTIAGQPGVAGVKTGPLPARLNRPGGIGLSGADRLVIADEAENALLMLAR